MNEPMIKITVYINESDKWEHHPLYLEILRMLHKKDIAGGTVLHAVAGFTNKGTIETATLVDAGSQLPLVVEFVDTAAKIDPILPLLKEMVDGRLILREEVEVVQQKGIKK